MGQLTGWGDVDKVPRALVRPGHGQYAGLDTDVIHQSLLEEYQADFALYRRYINRSDTEWSQWPPAY